jgi:outer membrane protein OmpA-like peptidoglycan-associated protein
MYQRSRRDETETSARRSIAAANEAIKLSTRRIEMDRLEKQITERQEQISQMESRARAAEDRAKEAQQLIEALRAQREEAQNSITEASRNLARLRLEQQSMQEMIANLDRERGQLRDSMQELQTEKSALQGRLQQALALVADTRESARGFIVNLPGILFDVGKATLKTDAKVALAKLAGILLIMQDLNLRIEGHTDSTGSASSNLRLSQRRADEVLRFLSVQGIDKSRMLTKGYGQDRPIADNSSARGRRQNRRVEIIVSEGVVAEEE